MCSAVTPCHFLLFVDYAKIFNAIPSQFDCPILQDALNKFTTWCNTFCLSLNITKCKVMSFYRTHLSITFDCKLGGLSVKRVNKVHYLEILFVPSLYFRTHIDTITNFEIFRRNLSYLSLSCCLQALYNALVRSILEHGVVVWSPIPILRD